MSTDIRYSHLVVDSGAIIKGASIANLSQKLYTVPEVVDEIRDPKSRQILELLQYKLIVLEPSLDSLNAVINFAKQTGDAPFLSQTDSKLLALLYELECKYGDKTHIRTQLPNTDIRFFKNTSEPRVVGVNVSESVCQYFERGCNRGNSCKFRHPQDFTTDPRQEKKGSIAQPTESSLATSTSRNTENTTEQSQLSVRPTKTWSVIPPLVSATDTTVEDFPPLDIINDNVKNEERELLQNIKVIKELYISNFDKNKSKDTKNNENNENINGNVEDNSVDEQCDGETRIIDTNTDIINNNNNNNSNNINENNNHIDNCTETKKINTPITSHIIGGTGAPSEWVNPDIDDGGGEWISNDNITSHQVLDNNYEQLDDNDSGEVAIITGDFYMQNISLQMNLRILTYEGYRIRQVKRWVLQCTACLVKVNDTTKLFCPSCGYPYLVRVAMYINKYGAVHYGYMPTKIHKNTPTLSIPSSNSKKHTDDDTIYREDQLMEGKYIHKLRQRGKSNKSGLDGVFKSANPLSNIKISYNKNTKNKKKKH